VGASDSDAFLSLLERYFSQPLHAKMADVRPDLAYQVSAASHQSTSVRSGPQLAAQARALDLQVGATPEGQEKPRCLRDVAIRAHAARLGVEHQPTLPSEADPK
jgi:hypothetical protein